MGSSRDRIKDGTTVRWRFRKNGPEHQGQILAFVPLGCSMRDAAHHAGVRGFYAEDRSGWDRYLIRTPSADYAVAAGTIERASATNGEPCP